MYPYSIGKMLCRLVIMECIVIGSLTSQSFNDVLARQCVTVLVCTHVWQPTWPHLCRLLLSAYSFQHSCTLSHVVSGFGPVYAMSTSFSLVRAGLCRLSTSVPNVRGAHLNQSGHSSWERMQRTGLV